MIEVALLLAALGVGVALGVFLRGRATQGVDELEARTRPSR